MAKKLTVDEEIKKAQENFKKNKKTKVEDLTPENEDDFLPEQKKPDNLTSEEAAIFQRVMSEDNEWQTLTEGDMEDFSLMVDPFLLPKEAEKLMKEKKFAFRWAERATKRIDELRNAGVPLRWWVVNRGSDIGAKFPDKLFDNIHGGIQRHDQLLMFKPWWMHEKVKEMKQALADASYNAGNIANRDRQKIDETGSEWLASPDQKISAKDEVIDPGGMLDSVYQQETPLQSGSEDLVI